MVKGNKMELKTYADKRRRVQKTFTKPSKTIQSAKDECDVNQIIQAFSKTGVLKHVNQMEAAYGDFSDVADYKTAIERVSEAQEAFLMLPAKVRAQFANDPENLMHFLSDENNYETANELGLLDETKVAEYKSKKAEQAKASEEMKQKELQKAIKAIEAKEKETK